MNFKLYGIRKEFIVENNLEKNNIILLLLNNDGNKRKYELFLNNLKLREVNGFIAPNFKLKRLIKNSFDLDKFINNIENGTSFEDNFFSFKTKETSYKIQLTNELFLNEEYFEEINSIRNKTKRPIWIFKGQSGLGKSYLSSFLKDFKEVYETDSNEMLPNVIYADVIILGNKYNFSEDDIKSRLFGNYEVIMVDFNKS